MHPREVRKRGESQYRIMLPDRDWHAAEDNPSRHCRRTHRRGNQNQPVSPMKEMPLAEGFEAACSQSAPCIKNPIGYVNPPRSQHHEQRNPKRQSHVRRPGEAQCPYDRDRRSIEAGQMPPAQGCGNVVQTGLGRFFGDGRLPGQRNRHRSILNSARLRFEGATRGRALRPPATEYPGLDVGSTHKEWSFEALKGELLLSGRVDSTSPARPT